MSGRASPPPRSVGVSIGSKNISIYEEGRGLILREPSVVAWENRTMRIVAVGEEASLLTRTGFVIPGSRQALEDILLLSPMTDGVIADFEAAEALLRNCFKKVFDKNSFLRVMASHPYRASEVEKRDLRRSLESAGAHEVHLIGNPLAAALGGSVPVHGNRGFVLVYCGDDTEAALIAHSSIIECKRTTAGGARFDEAIIQYMRRAYNLRISKETAEALRDQIGSCWPAEKEVKAEVRGLDVTAGLPKTLPVTSPEIREALLEPITAIIDCIRKLLADCPAEFSPDIVDHGIILAGSGALLRGFDYLIAKETGLAVHTLERPTDVLVEGAGKAFSTLQFPKPGLTTFKPPS
jgi:rod shape-determining protein MreB